MCCPWAASGRGTVIVVGRSTRSLEVILTIVLIALIVAVAGLNALATAVVARSSLYEPRQKWLQYAFIWVVPILGGLMSWSLAHEPKSRRHTTDLTDSYSPDDGDLRLGGGSHGSGHFGGGEGESSGGGDGHD